MATRIYKTPFAATGDKETLATADQPDGKVSLQAGWTPDYELPNDNANYRPVGRAEMNGIFGEVTEGLGDMQLNGFATWQAIDGGWPNGALVTHGGLKYQSTTASNATTPGAVGGNWEPVLTTVGTLPVASTSVVGIVELATNAETQAGADAGRAVTPAGLQSKVQSGITDATSGRLLVVGAFGWGGSTPSLGTLGYPADFNQIDVRTENVAVAGNMVNGPAGAGTFSYTGIVKNTMRGGTTGVTFIQELNSLPSAPNANGNWIRYGTGGTTGARTWTEWEQVYTSRTIPAASTSVPGISRIATVAEAQAGTNDAAVLSPAKLAAVTATETRRGVAALATTAQAGAGTDDASVMTPKKTAEAIARLGPHTVQALTGSGTFTVPAGTFFLDVEMWGGGGGGGGVGTAGSIAAGGGGAGEYVRFVLPVNPGGSIAYAVGAAGSAGGAGGAGGNGGSTIFGSYSAMGGSGGSPNGTGNGGAGGTGGAGAVSIRSSGNYGGAGGTAYGNGAMGGMGGGAAFGGAGGSNGPGATGGGGFPGGGGAGRGTSSTGSGSPGSTGLIILHY
ncbi:hypothetical protein [Achromobacter sp. ACRQX]|uniref:glycine-rich domain-containing protein n=1 Tax=Achromobacter sp. ACRQX TaxID=2918181 RepID=UPI001EF2590A|nr:hypothetical protein [Achromobacter sp. ACRQX]MCG7324271.1 hypothetical protein [Achromobacter sp. ACRQX]